MRLASVIFALFMVFSLSGCAAATLDGLALPVLLETTEPEQAESLAEVSESNSFESFISPSLEEISLDILQKLNIPEVPGTEKYFSAPGATYIAADSNNEVLGVYNYRTKDWSLGKQEVLGAAVLSRRGNYVWNSAKQGEYNEVVTEEFVQNVQNRFPIEEHVREYIDEANQLPPHQMLLHFAAIIIADGNIEAAQEILSDYGHIEKIVIAVGWQPDIVRGEVQTFLGQSGSETFSAIINNEIVVFTGFLTDEEDVPSDGSSVLNRILTTIIKTLDEDSKMTPSSRNIFDRSIISTIFDAENQLTFSPIAKTH